MPDWKWVLHDDGHRRLIVPGISPASSRIAFKEADSVERTRRRGLVSEREMSADNVEMMCRLFQEVIWLCDVVLNTPVRSEVFCRFFKDHRYHHAVFKIFAWVRALAKSFLDGDVGPEQRPIFSRKSQTIIMVHGYNPSHPDHIATMDCNQHTMYLWDSFVFGWQETVDFNELYLALTYLIPGNEIDPEIFVNTRAGLMLHELVHYASFLKMGEFREATGCRRAQRMIDRYFDGIYDGLPIEYWHRRNEGDRAVVKNFQQSYRTRRGTRKRNCLAYGVNAAEQMATLEDGACASLVNCDSYLVYAAASCVEYLKECYGVTTRNMSTLCAEELLSRTPGVDDLAVQVSTARIKASLPSMEGTEMEQAMMWYRMQEGGAEAATTCL